MLFIFARNILGEILDFIESVSECFPTYSCISELLCMCCVVMLENHPIHSFNALIIAVLRVCLPIYVLVERLHAFCLFQMITNLKLLKLSILLLGIWMILIVTSLIAWSIIFALENFSLIRPISQIPGLIYVFIFIYIRWFCDD